MLVLHLRCCFSVVPVYSSICSMCQQYAELKPTRGCPAGQLLMQNAWPADTTQCLLSSLSEKGFDTSGHQIMMGAVRLNPGASLSSSNVHDGCMLELAAATEKRISFCVKASPKLVSWLHAAHACVHKWPNALHIFSLVGPQQTNFASCREQAVQPQHMCCGDHRRISTPWP